MKKLLISILSLSASILLLAAPGQQGRFNVRLMWDVYNWQGETNNIGFVLYEQIPLNSTNWVKVMNVSPSVNECVVSNVTAGIHTYALTATNYWGESDLSNTASTPRFPGKPVNLKYIE